MGNTPSKRIPTTISAGTILTDIRVVAWDSTVRVDTIHTYDRDKGVGGRIHANTCTLHSWTCTATTI